MTEKEYVPLFQEWLKEDPFWMLVACSLVNLTHWRVSSRVLDVLMRESNNDPSWFGQVPDEELQEILMPLGLWRRRAKNLKAMAARWIESPLRDRREVLKVPGCGRYASDSWAIFMEGDLTVEPTDGRLQEYLDNARSLS